jgi:hypothetical protein
VYAYALFVLVDTMPRKSRVNSMGDCVEWYTKEELVEMYKAEGYEDEIAISLAERLISEMSTLNHQTKNVWKRSRNR